MAYTRMAYIRTAGLRAEPNNTLNAIVTTGWEQARFDLYRRVLLVLTTFLLPVSQILEASGKKINFSFADLACAHPTFWRCMPCRPCPC